MVSLCLHFFIGKVGLVVTPTFTMVIRGLENTVGP